MYKNNVIDFLEVRSRTQHEKSEKAVSKETSLISLTEKRAEVLKAERRDVKRTILTEFISAHVVVPERGLIKVSLYDISEDGLSFEMDKEHGEFNLGEEVAFRIYLNHKTYFPFYVSVKNQRWIEEEGTYRIGVKYLKESFNSEALTHFVQFIEAVSANLKSDNGDVMVSSINS